MIELFELVFWGLSLQFEGVFTTFLIHSGKTKIIELDFSYSTWQTLLFGIGTSFLGIVIWTSCLGLIDFEFDNRVRITMFFLFVLATGFRYFYYKESIKKELAAPIQKFYLIVFIVGIIQIFIPLLFLSLQ